MPDPYGQPATGPDEPRPPFWNDPASAPAGYPGPGSGSSYPTHGNPAHGNPTQGNPSHPGSGYGTPPGTTPPTWPPYGTGTPPYGTGTPPYPSTPPPPPPRRRRGLMIAVIAAVVALALCGGVATALYIVGSGEADRSTRANGSASAGQAPAKVSFAAPEQVGSMRKSANQAQADTLRDRLRTSGVEEPFAVTYDDPTTKRLAILWGGTGRAFGLGGSDKQLDGFFGAAGKDLNGGTIGAPVSVDPGPTGGNAECAKVDGLGVVMSVCAWAGTNALLGFILSGLTPDQGGEQLRAMLPSIVVEG